MSPYMVSSAFFPSTDASAYADLLAKYRAKLAEAPEVSDDEDAPPKAYWQAQIDWLTERFPDSKYRDVIGLCKVAALGGEDGIIEQDYSLNPGRYVGVVIEDDGMTQEEFQTEIMQINSEFSNLSSNAHNLEKKIAQNLTSLFT